MRVFASPRAAENQGFQIRIVFVEVANKVVRALEQGVVMERRQ
jgi:hypothetical protein